MQIEELTRICIECPIGGESCGLSHAGRSFVSIDSVDDPDRIIYGRTAADFRYGDQEEDDDDSDELDENKNNFLDTRNAVIYTCDFIITTRKNDFFQRGSL